MKKYLIPLLRLAREGILHPPSDVYVRSFLCPISYFNKTATQKLLSDQAWSLVLKLNLFQESDIVHHKLSAVKNRPASSRYGFNLWVWKIPLEKEMATHSSILA